MVDSAMSRTESEQKRIMRKIPTWPTDTLMPSVTFVSITDLERDVLDRKVFKDVEKSSWVHVSFEMSIQRTLLGLMETFF